MTDETTKKADAAWAVARAARADADAAWVSSNAARADADAAWAASNAAWAEWAAQETELHRICEEKRNDQPKRSI